MSPRDKLESRRFEGQRGVGSEETIAGHVAAAVVLSLLAPVTSLIGASGFGSWGAVAGLVPLGGAVWVLARLPRSRTARVKIIFGAVAATIALSLVGIYVLWYLANT